MYNQLKENIIKQIGLEAFEQIEAELLDPKKQREVKSRTKMQILKLRAMKEKLRNSDIFHSLIHHLNSQRLNKVPEEEDGNCSLLSFYRDIDRKLKEGMESPHIIRGDDLDKDQEECEVESHNFKQNFQLRALLLRQEIARNEELSKKNKVPEAVMNLVEHVDDDRQVRVAGVLNAYKERSNKVIKLLKKKTMTIGQKDVKTDRAAIEDTKVRLNKIFDPIENPSSRTNRTQMKIKIRTDSKPYLPILTRDESSAQVKTRSNWKTNAQNCFEYEESLALHPPKLRLTESSPSPSKFQQNILENKKRFNRINGQKLLRSSQGSYRENKNSPCEYGIYSGVDLSLKRSPSKISERFQIENIRKKRGCFSFEKSLEGIKGMLNDLSQTNREFGSELENSKTTMKTYYDTKINSIQKEEIPESLRLQIQTEDAKGRAALIMKLTKKVLRDAYDY